MEARKSPIGRARGYGSSQQGTASWWTQRMTAIALVPLGIWFIASMVALVSASQPEVAAWLASRRTAVMMGLLVLAVFYHLALGMHEIVEDYVHHETVKLLSLVLINFTCIALTFMCIFSVLRLAIGG